MSSTLVPTKAQTYKGGKNVLKDFDVCFIFFVIILLPTFYCYLYLNKCTFYINQ